jgi:hypothetical protein
MDRSRILSSPGSSRLCLPAMFLHFAIAILMLGEMNCVVLFRASCPVAIV